MLWKRSRLVYIYGKIEIIHQKREDIIFFDWATYKDGRNRKADHVRIC